MLAAHSRMGKRVANKREKEREEEKETGEERTRVSETEGEGGSGGSPDKFLSVIMDTSKASRVFNEDHPPMASHRR